MIHYCNCLENCLQANKKLILVSLYKVAKTLLLTLIKPAVLVLLCKFLTSFFEINFKVVFSFQVMFSDQEKEECVILLLK